MGEPFFKLTHLGRQIKLKSAGMNKFNFKVYDKSTFDPVTIKDGEKFSLRASAPSTDPYLWDYGMRLAEKELLDRSFVIESLPQGTDFNCGRPNSVNLKPVGCRGDLHLRRPNKDDF